MKFKVTVICICTIAILVAGISMLVSTAKAAEGTSTIEVKWTFTAEEQAGIRAFRIYDKDNLVVAEDIAPAIRVASFETDNICNSWQVVGVVGTGENEIESSRSNSIPWCPETPIVPTPGTFTLSGSVTLTPVQ